MLIRENGSKGIFNKRVEQLKAYKDKHGHNNVRAKDDESLHDACMNFRRAVTHAGIRQRTTLDEDQIQQFYEESNSYSIPATQDSDSACCSKGTRSTIDKRPEYWQKRSIESSPPDSNKFKDFKKKHGS